MRVKVVSNASFKDGRWSEEGGQLLQLECGHLVSWKTGMVALDGNWMQEGIPEYFECNGQHDEYGQKKEDWLQESVEAIFTPSPLWKYITGSNTTKEKK